MMQAFNYLDISNVILFLSIRGNLSLNTIRESEFIQIYLFSDQKLDVFLGFFSSSL